MVAALIPHPREPRRYLVQQRLPGGSRPLLWEFPGGKVEEGEGEELALRRECQEELGVELEVGRLLSSTAHRYPDLSLELLLYEARILRGEPRCLGAQAVEFLTPEEMRARPFCEADLPLVEALASGRLKASGSQGG